MFRLKGLILAAVMVCFAFMAFKSNCVLADDAVELKIWKKTKIMNTRTRTLESILNTQVLPRLGSVPKTGQTTSYATGDDGDLQMGTAWPNPRFTDNDDGTVTDNMTGLVWLKNAECFGQETWADALSDCIGLESGTCGLTDGSIAGDWRLPNLNELQSLVHRGFYIPPVPDTAGTGQWSEGDPFTGVQSSYYWSATTFAQVTDNAWYVVMVYGNVGYGNKSVSGYVWPVRAGK